MSAARLNFTGDNQDRIANYRVVQYGGVGRGGQVNMSTDLTQTPQREISEIFFMIANKHAAKAQIKCHSREATFERAAAIRCYSQTNQQAESYANEIKLSIFMFRG